MNKNSADTQRNNWNGGQLTPWKPGQSGNPKGRPKGSKNFSTIAKEALDKLQDLPDPLRENIMGAFKDVNDGRTALIYAAIQKALVEGDIQAMKFIRDTADGVPTHTLDVSMTSKLGSPIDEIPEMDEQTAAQFYQDMLDASN